MNFFVATFVTFHWLGITLWVLFVYHCGFFFIISCHSCVCRHLMVTFVFLCEQNRTKLRAEKEISNARLFKQTAQWATVVQSQQLGGWAWRSHCLIMVKETLHYVTEQALLRFIMQVLLLLYFLH